MAASSIHNLVRGLSYPYIGAHFVFNGETFKVWKTRTSDSRGLENLEPGRVIKYADSVVTIKCGNGCITLIDVEPAPNFHTGVCL
jgi:methionyl-tRNA formyltransferase